MLSLYAQFDVCESFSTGDEMGVFLLVGEVVVVVLVVMGVVNIVGVVATQGEHSEECNIEEGTLAEVVGEESGGKGAISGTCIGTCWGRGCFWGYAFEGPSNGSSVTEGTAHTFLAAPSLLSLLPFRFVDVSIFSWSSLFFFPFFFFANVGDTGVVDVAVVFVGVCGPFLVVGVVACSAVVAAAGSGVLVWF